VAQFNGGAKVFGQAWAAAEEDEAVGRTSDAGKSVIGTEMRSIMSWLKKSASRNARSAYDANALKRRPRPPSWWSIAILPFREVVGAAKIRRLLKSVSLNS
jgi:hypothetical protein